MRLSECTILQDAVDRASIVIDVCKLAKAVCGDVKFSDGKGVVKKAESRDRRNVSGWLARRRWDNCMSQCCGAA